MKYEEKATGRVVERSQPSPALDASPRWAQLEEVAEWETTLGDGLDDEIEGESDDSSPRNEEE